jgi:hypothetical protein
MGHMLPKTDAQFRRKVWRFIGNFAQNNRNVQCGS